MTEAKIEHLRSLSTSEGIIAAVAMDQRGSLRKAIGAAKDIDPGEVTPAMMSEFKSAVSKVLSPYASAILLDPEFGLEAARLRSARAGLILAYDQSGYDNTRPGRMPALIPGISVNRIVRQGANAVKLLLYYSPFEDPDVNGQKHAFVERVGAECACHDVPFFIEPLGYNLLGGDTKSFEYARRKPEIVKRTMEEFTKPQYHVDVMKVEAPVNTSFMEGSVAFGGQQAYTKAEALDHFRVCGEATDKPFIYLSAGVSNEQFVESLRLAAESGAGFSGVLCGRATWKGGIAVYANDGPEALEQWLSVEGVRNIKAVNEALEGATPWRRP